jgi:hypothetical protein
MARDTCLGFTESNDMFFGGFSYAFDAISLVLLLLLLLLLPLLFSYTLNPNLFYIILPQDSINFEHARTTIQASDKQCYITVSKLFFVTFTDLHLTGLPRQSFNQYVHSSLRFL